MRRSSYENEVQKARTSKCPRISVQDLGRLVFLEAIVLGCDGLPVHTHTHTNTGIATQLRTVGFTTQPWTAFRGLKYWTRFIKYPRTSFAVMNHGKTEDTHQCEVFDAHVFPRTSACVFRQERTCTHVTHIKARTCAVCLHIRQYEDLTAYLSGDLCVCTHTREDRLVNMQTLYI